MCRISGCNHIMTHCARVARKVSVLKRQGKRGHREISIVGVKRSRSGKWRVIRRQESRWVNYERVQTTCKFIRLLILSYSSNNHETKGKHPGSSWSVIRQTECCPATQYARLAANWDSKLLLSQYQTLERDTQVRSADCSIVYLCTSITWLKAWWRHQTGPFSALLALCAGNSPVPVNSPYNGQWRGALMISLICVWINDWVNNREAGAPCTVIDIALSFVFFENNSPK